MYSPKRRFRVVRNPALYGSLQVWLDAADSSTLTLAGDGTQVTQWADKSGNGRHATQSTVANAPRLSTGIQNGRDGIAFSSTPGTCLNLPDFTTVPYTIFMVMKYATTGNTGIALFLHRSGQGGNTAIFRNLYGDAPNPIYQSIGVDYGGSAFRYMAASPGVNDTATHIQTFSLPNSSVGNFYLDGVLGDSTAGFTQSTGTATKITLGAYNQKPAEVPLNGTIHEVIWYDSVLSASNRNAVHSYLSAKWAVPLA